MDSYGYKIYLDIDKDASNWWGACNSFSHGTNWKDRIDKGLADQVKGKSFDESKKFLIPYLEGLYIDKSAAIQACKKGIKVSYENKFQEACRRLELVTNRPLFRKNYKIYLTTFPRCPYSLREGAFWIYIQWDDYIQTFLHEVHHFQFIHYWRNADTKVKKLPWRQFEFLKESLTVVLDEDFVDIAGAADEGYPIHQELREVLHRRWREDKDFDRLVDYGVGILNKYYKEK